MGAKSLPKFWQAHSMSKSAYYGNKAEGLGPRETNNGARVTISDEAADEWRLLMEVLTAIIDLPEGKKENVREAVQMLFPREEIPKAIFDKAWAHAPAKRTARERREQSRRKAVEGRMSKSTSPEAA